jgi:hypothetical protein
MLGFGPLGSMALGELPDIARILGEVGPTATIVLSSLIPPVQAREPVILVGRNLSTALSFELASETNRERHLQGRAPMAPS